MFNTKGCNNNCVSPTKTQAHCSMCHITFATVTLFDQHHANCYITPQTDLYKRGDGMSGQEFVCECISPETMGLVLYNGTWYTKNGLQVTQRRVASLQAARSQPLP